mgnify:CR=1 FL=1
MARSQSRNYAKLDMNASTVSRRAMLGSAAGLALAASVWSLARQRELSAPERHRLLAMARRFYPHDDLPDSVYEECLDSFYMLAMDDPVVSSGIQSGMNALNSASDGDWINATPDVQNAALKTIENSNFFATVQDEVRYMLYQHPSVWALIGYEGPSVQFGGYLERGFADIDWLPKD